MLRSVRCHYITAARWLKRCSLAVAYQFNVFVPKIVAIVRQEIDMLKCVQSLLSLQKAKFRRVFIHWNGLYLYTVAAQKNFAKMKKKKKTDSKLHTRAAKNIAKRWKMRTKQLEKIWWCAQWILNCWCRSVYISYLWRDVCMDVPKKFVYIYRKNTILYMCKELTLCNNNVYEC